MAKTMNYLKISDVAALIGVSTQTIRRMEERQVIDPPRRERSGRRYYTLDDAQRIYFSLRPSEMGAEPFSQRWNQWIETRKKGALSSHD